jgi:hypothetical protein
MPKKVIDADTDTTHGHVLVRVSPEISTNHTLAGEVQMRKWSSEHWAIPLSTAYSTYLEGQQQQQQRRRGYQRVRHPSEQAPLPDSGRLVEI